MAGESSETDQVQQLHHVAEGKPAGAPGFFLGFPMVV
jgi:hypothetical protein